jgi:hypothetical protein
VEPEDRTAMEQRLPVLELIEQALIRRAEVLEMVESSADQTKPELGSARHSE